MTTRYIAYTREIPHERDYIDGLRTEILKHPNGVTVRDLLRGRDETAVLASLRFLVEHGEVTEKIDPDHGDLFDGTRVFPSAELLRSICS